MLRVITPPTTEPVSLAEARALLRVDDTSEDATLSVLISSARASAEAFTGRSFAQQTVLFTTTLMKGVGFPITGTLRSGERTFRLPLSPVASIASVKAWDGSAWVPVDYSANTETGEIELDSFSEKVQVEFTTLASCPPDVKQALLAHVAHMFENRGDMATPHLVAAMLKPHRRVSL